MNNLFGQLGTKWQNIIQKGSLSCYVYSCNKHRLKMEETVRLKSRVKFGGEPLRCKLRELLRELPSAFFSPGNAKVLPLASLNIPYVSVHVLLQSSTA